MNWTGKITACSLVVSHDGTKFKLGTHPDWEGLLDPNISTMQTALRTNKKILRKSIEMKLRELSPTSIQEQCSASIFDLFYCHSDRLCYSTVYHSPDLILAFLYAK